LKSRCRISATTTPFPSSKCTKPGDTINAEDALVTLESDKATMDVPSPQAGTVKEVRIKVGDNVSEGSVLVMLEPAGAAAAAPAPQPLLPARPLRPGAGCSRCPGPAAAPAGGGTVEVKVPDIGDYDAVPVIEVHVKPGDQINAEDALVTLESDKATMDVPSPRPARSRKSRSRSATTSPKAR
jgi:pyruvate dehydrogenase E2 component (dihydrolipoamide acetyltransferase)